MSLVDVKDKKRFPGAIVCTSSVPGSVDEETFWKGKIVVAGPPQMGNCENNVIRKGICATCNVLPMSMLMSTIQVLIRLVHLLQQLICWTLLTLVFFVF